jgi:hypothetical protein
MFINVDLPAPSSPNRLCFPTAYVKVHAAQDVDAGKGFADAAHFQHGV